MAAEPGGPLTWVLTFPPAVAPGVQFSVGTEESSPPVTGVKEILKRSRSRKDRMGRKKIATAPQCWEVRQQVLLPTPENKETGNKTPGAILEDDIETCVVSFEDASKAKEERGTKTEVIVGPNCVITIEEEEVGLGERDSRKPETVLEDDIEACVVHPKEVSGAKKKEIQPMVIDGGNIEDFVESLEDIPRIDKATQTDVMEEAISKVYEASIQKAAHSQEELKGLEKNDRTVVSSPEKTTDSKGEEETHREKETHGSCKNPGVGDKGDDEKTEPAIFEEGGIVMETARQGFRWFRYPEAEDPRNAYEKLRELCHLWLKPESRTKEQILELLVLEQFLAILPQEIQTWVWQQHPETCAQAVDLVENFMTGLSLLKRHGKMALVTFEEVAMSFSEEEWRLLNKAQKKTYQKVMLENYENVKSLGFPVLKPDLIVKMENSRNQDLYLQDPKNSPERPSLGVVGDAVLSSESKCEEETTWKEEETTDTLASVPEPPSPLKGWEATVQSSPPSKQESKSRWFRTEPRFGCPDCDKTFAWQSALARHKLSHSGEKPYSCPECPKGFERHAQLVRHQRQHTGEACRKCPECGKVFCDRYKLARHQKIHSKNRPHRCDICDREFCLSSNLQQHRLVHTGKRPHECPKCGRYFSRRSNLNQHLRVHQRQEEGRQSMGLHSGDSELGPGSDLCEEEWEYEWIADTQDGEPMAEFPMESGREQLPGLPVENSDGKPIAELSDGNREDEEILELCVGDYERRWTKEIHEQGDIMALQAGNHEHQENLEISAGNPENEEIVEFHVGNGDEQGWNEELNRKDYDSLLVSGRGLLHSNSQESSPSPSPSSDQTLVSGTVIPQGSDCGRTFTHISSLNQHQVIHATERPYACRECCRSFILPSLLSQHQLTHAPGHLHPCPDCPQSFSQRSELLRHQRIHTRERSFQCTDCGKSYRNNSILLRHQRMYHDPQSLGCVPVPEQSSLSSTDPVVFIL